MIISRRDEIGKHAALKMLWAQALVGSTPTVGTMSKHPAKRIESLRKKRGLSQEKLARLADVSNNTIIKIEAGKNQNPTLDTLKKIAKALEVSVDDLIN